jgi:circadian clock protein KaiC
MKKPSPDPTFTLLPTGIPGLDTVLGGGLPEFSFNLVAGSPGAGKTTLAQQMIFRNATMERPALYFTVLGEPTLKMVRYQRLYSFFKPALIESAIRFVNLSEEALQPDLNGVLERIVSEVERLKPRMVVVDSFRTIIQRGASTSAGEGAALGMESFIQKLALHLTTWEVTSLMIGEYAEEEQRNAVFTVADGIFWLSQAIDRNSVVRKLQVVKSRGQALMPGLHTFRITGDGLQVFPRIPEQQHSRKEQAEQRLLTGVPGLDEMLGGGIPAGDAAMLIGPAGSGKTTFAVQFIAEGLRNDESCVIVVFEEYPEEYLARTRYLDVDLEAKVLEGKLDVLYLRPLDLSVDEALFEILESVTKLGASRVVIDSLSGFEIALAPTFREDFRESFYRLIGALTATGVTILMTAEIMEGFSGMRFTSERVSFITDDIIAQRYVEIEGELRKVIAVVKMRGSGHSVEFREYDITNNGPVIGRNLKAYHGITTGVPELYELEEAGDVAGVTPLD